MEIRNICPSDYKNIIQVLDEWWGGRRMADMLPKLFFVHFCETSFIAEINQITVGFVIAFLSQTCPDEAYIHFAGIHPDFRKKGVGSTLYRHVFQTVHNLGRTRVKCVTSPVNKDSIAYHLQMGFTAEPGEHQEDGVPYHLDYDGAGEHRVLFVKQL